MKITDVTVTLFAWNDIPATRYATHTGLFSGQSQLGLVAVSTDEGIVGHAFLGSSSYPADLDAGALIAKLKPQILGHDPLDRERLYEALCERQRHTTWRTIGAVDVALWDIAGKVAGLPIHRLMGTYRHAAPAYASSAMLDSAEAYADEACAFKERGWKAYKIHPPQTPKRDIEVCEAVRKAVGDDFTLMLDATWSYRYEDALRVGRAIEALGFYWYEDPLADDDLHGCAKLREKLDVPLLATEYSPGAFHAYQPWILMRATDMLRGDVAVKGGITSVLKSAHLAEAFRMNYEIHHGGNSLNNVASLHVLMAIPNSEFFEVLLPSGAQKYGLVADVEVDADGLVHAPDGPGLGYQIDFELIERNKTAVLQ